jgi:hypothetical protein
VKSANAFAPIFAAWSGAFSMPPAILTCAPMRFMVSRMKLLTMGKNMLICGN